MNILIFGAGAIGSLFGAHLSEHSNVTLIGRKPHIDKINKNGLIITGRTQLKVKVSAYCNIEQIKYQPDIIIIAVKSYDTKGAMKNINKIMQPSTSIISLQNGLDNIEKISKYAPMKKINVCITTHGALFERPAVIKHTGIGKTTIGNISDIETDTILDFLKLINKTEIKTTLSKNTKQEIWQKAIINSSINPLTTFFKIKNGYLLENPILERLVEKVCLESTNIACSNDVDISYNEMIEKTKQVITDTSDNYSSMLQSRMNNKKTEIDSINGYIVKIGKKQGVDTRLNEMIVHSIKNL